MKTFGEYTELNEAIGRSNWVKAGSVFLAAKVKGYGEDVRSSTTANDKLDNLSHQNSFLAGLMLLNLASNLNDKSILKGIKR
jgi:hypothetical protein